MQPTSTKGMPEQVRLSGEINLLEIAQDLLGIEQKCLTLLTNGICINQKFTNEMYQILGNFEIQNDNPTQVRKSEGG